jgi:ATP-dependent Clp protease adapter protein ClpS
VSLIDRTWRQPRFYNVIINDSKGNQLDLFAALLQAIFHVPYDESYSIAMKIKVMGYVQLGVFTRDVAETKVEAARRYADRLNLNFDCILERVEERYVVKKS